MSTKTLTATEGAMNTASRAIDSFTTSAVQTYLEVKHAFDECDDDVKAVIADMIDIWNAKDSTTEEKQSAVHTIVEALFPRLCVDFIEAESEFRKSPYGQVREAELDEQEATFANRLANLMKEKGMTQPQLAEATGVGQPAICNMLNRACRPQQRTVKKFAKALGVSPDELWPQS